MYSFLCFCMCDKSYPQNGCKYTLLCPGSEMCMYVSFISGRGEGAGYFIGCCVFFGNSEGGHSFSVNLISASDKTVKIL